MFNKLNQFDQAVNANLTHGQNTGDIVNGGAGAPGTGFLSPITEQFGSTGCTILIIALIALLLGIGLFLLRNKFRRTNRASIIASLGIFAFSIASLVAASSVGAGALPGSGKNVTATNAVTMNLTTTPEGATTTASANAMLQNDFLHGYIVYAYVDEDPMLWNYDYSDAIDLTWPAASINDLAMNSYGIQNQDGSFDIPSIDPKKPTKIADITTATYAGTNIPINYALRANTSMADGGYSTLSYAIHYEVVANEYKLTYDYGDVAKPKITTQIQDPVFTIDGREEAEDRTGYTFNGYTLNESRVEEDVHNYIQPGSQFVADYVDTTLYASWTANTYKATFDTNGGKFPSGKTRTIKDEVFDSTYVMPKTTPTRTGYTFAGWWTEKDGGEQIDNESIVSIAEDHTIYAHWIANQCVAYFDANGGEFAPGEAVRTKVETYDDTYILPKKQPTRTGYQFAGWYNEAGVKVTSATKVTTDVDHILYAHWTANTYTLSYNANGGQNAPISQTQSGNPTFTVTTEEPTRTGYTFLGWATKPKAKVAQYYAGDTITLDDPETGFTSEQILYAIWEANSYSVTFEANGGEFAPGEATVSLSETYDSNYIMPATEPTRIGYRFAGWFTKKGPAGIQITAEDIVQTDSDHTLHAHWVANTYKLSYDANGGTNAPVAQEQSGKPTFTVTETQPIRTGYTFKGWATTKEATAPEYTAGSSITLKEPETGNVSEQTLYAVWEIETYQVQFDANGGEFTPGETVRVKTETYGEKYIIPDKKPTRIGYQFAGWFTAKEGGTHVTANTTVTTTTDHTLYAHWTANTYKLSYDANGGTGAPNTQEQSGEPTFVVVADVPKLKGHKLLGWATTQAATEVEYRAGDSITLSEPATGDTSTQTLYAVWQAKAYPVTFNANGGEFAPTETTKTIDETYGETYKLPEADPTQTGYKFVGWFTEPVGGEQVTAETTVAITQATTLYAHWQREQYVVTFNANNGHFPDGSDSQKIKITYLDNYQLPEKKPEREGYKFIGWYTKEDGGIEITSETQMTTAKKHTLYAHWQANSYEVTYDANGGKFADGQATDGPHSLTFDSPYVLPQQELSRTGYTFAGWWTEKIGGDEIIDTTPVKIAKEHTIYAHWTANKYTVTFDATSGAFEGDAKSEQIQETYDNYYALPADDPTLDDYKFLGWFTGTTTGQKVTEENKVQTASDRTLYAHWGKDLVFDANGGTFEGGKNELTITETLNAYMVLPEQNPTHADGKYFAGWFTAQDGGQQVTSANKYNKATLLYAHWSDTSPVTMLSRQYTAASAAPVANVPHYESAATPPATRSRTSRVAR